MGVAPPLTPILRSRPEFEALDAEVYRVLRAVAAALMGSERSDHTLQSTALAHEAFLRLRESSSLDPTDPRQWRIAAIGVMRRILVDHARGKRRMKRGGSWTRVSLDEAEGTSCPSVEVVLDVHEALCELEQLDERRARVVELRYFAGLSNAEVGETLGVSERTVRLDWQWARAWLQTQLADTR